MVGPRLGATGLWKTQRGWAEERLWYRVPIRVEIMVMG